MVTKIRVAPHDWIHNAPLTFEDVRGHLRTQNRWQVLHHEPHEALGVKRSPGAKRKAPDAERLLSSPGVPSSACSCSCSCSSYTRRCITDRVAVSARFAVRVLVSVIVCMVTVSVIAVVPVVFVAVALVIVAMVVVTVVMCLLLRLFVQSLLVGATRGEVYMVVSRGSDEREGRREELRRGAGAGRVLVMTHVTVTGSGGPHLYKCGDGTK